MISGSFGAPDASASAFTIRSIAASTCLRTPSSKVRTFNLIIASSGITFSFVPACSAPIVTTAESVGATSRETIVCSLITVEAAMTTGSILASGIEPCAPRPNKRICRLSAAEVTTPVTPIEVPRRQAHDVLPEHAIGLGKTFEEPIVNHGLSALCSLLPWLKDWHQRSMPAIAAFGKKRGRSNQAGHVHVVPTGVRHWHGLAIRAFCRNCTRIGETSSFLDGQRIHVSAQHYGWTFSIAQYTDNARFADCCGDLKPVGLEMIRRNLSGSCLVHRQFGVGVDVFVD